MKRQTTVRPKDDPKQYRKELYALEKQETKRVNLTLTLAEYNRLKSEASRAKLSATKYAYAAVMATIDQRMKKYLPAPATITMLLQSLLPVARNFNQLVRRANTFGVTGSDLKEANQRLALMQKMIEQSFENTDTVENRVVAYLHRDPEALAALERIITEFKTEKNIQ